MAKTLKYERRTMQCAEEKRTATLLLEWREEGGRRTLVGVECDNPKLRGLEPYVCQWSCWHKLEPGAAKKVMPAKRAAKKQAEKAAPKPVKKAAPKKKKRTASAAAQKSKARR